MRRLISVIALSFIWPLFAVTVAKSSRDKILNYIFETQKYKNHERPNDRDVTEVTVYMKILAINSVEVRNMEYSMDMYLRQAWRDKRLAWSHVPEFRTYNSNIVSPSLKTRIWLPDLFFRNGKEGYLHNMTLPNYLMRVTPEGDVLYSQKITMRFSCQMDLTIFPMDDQHCEMDIGSYGYTADQLVFKWKKVEPIVLGNELEIPEFKKPTNTTCIDCTENASTSTGRYTCIKAIFHLQRQLGSYLASTYIPNGLIIMVSWLNFWVSIEAVPARITLGLLTLLGILTQAGTVSSNLPRVSYIKAIDIWTMTCILFVVAALVEFAVATTMNKRQKSNQWHKEVRLIVRQELAHWCAACQQQQMQYNSHFTTAAANVTSSSPGTMLANRRQPDFCDELETVLTYQVIDDKKDNNRVVAERPLTNEDSDVDLYSRFLFPACFLLYNCFYWMYYLVLVHYLKTADGNTDS